MRTIIFGVTKNAVTVHVNTKAYGKAGTRPKMRLLLEKLNLTDSDVVMFSSSMDFPHEYTSDRNVLALVKRFQQMRTGREPRGRAGNRGRAGTRHAKRLKP